eukprot:CAMPEP_0181354384 /NCGR_PEP_ID=MMETSP1106-20121128/3333_1 /TAXON_ID=81844 /ORGANISM="Mantoniella antarctica, Strain SL-175" /LENGTH=151 /DNA_ID=CAMNT_0023467045 /DNA_START=82 /DNA_END=534 /DNA_ORIENTATION=-
MGGWKDDPPPSSATVGVGAGGRAAPTRRREEHRPSSRNSIGGGDGARGESWRDSMAPVKEAAARGQNSSDALQVAVRRFLEGAYRGAGGFGFSSLGDATAAEVASDVLLLMRAVNRRPPAVSGGPSQSGSSVKVGATSMSCAFNALLGDLL